MTVSNTYDDRWQKDKTWDHDRKWDHDNDRDRDKAWHHDKDWNEKTWDHDDRAQEKKSDDDNDRHARDDGHHRDDGDWLDWHEGLKDFDLSKLWEAGLKWAHDRWFDGDSKDHKDHGDGLGDWLEYGDYDVVHDHHHGDKVVISKKIEPDVKYHDGWVELSYRRDGHDKTVEVWRDDVPDHVDWHDIA